jgi:hypothetical protein
MGGKCDKASYGKEQLRRFRNDGPPSPAQTDRRVNAPIQERGQDPEVLRLQPCTEPSSVNRARNPEYHAEQRHCHATFLIAYEAPVAPLRTPTHRINLRYVRL